MLIICWGLGVVVVVVVGGAGGASVVVVVVVVENVGIIAPTNLILSIKSLTMFILIPFIKKS